MARRTGKRKAQEPKIRSAGTEKEENGSDSSSKRRAMEARVRSDGIYAETEGAKGMKE